MNWIRWSPRTMRFFQLPKKHIKKLFVDEGSLETSFRHWLIIVLTLNIISWLYNINSDSNTVVTTIAIPCADENSELPHKTRPWKRSININAVASFPFVAFADMDDTHKSNTQIITNQYSTVQYSTVVVILVWCVIRDAWNPSVGESMICSYVCVALPTSPTAHFSRSGAL